MNENEVEFDPQEPLFKRLRGSLFPVQPGDSVFKKVLKNSGFYAVAVMVSLISLLLMGIVTFVL
ncbi:hypothetical protein COR50_19735 [Chitinophaga caeni]|uniref:Uncharacterized protein n=1 Tax=Chitinophaga caeni TaxID=2029983 RepID=A0A291QZ19_9BACT|nr:hypothetical protein [Chitinophaga caeni]ATL49226.1 hypothetical protein COR50_19735 [Chitinophaga caeni]